MLLVLGTVRSPFVSLVRVVCCAISGAIKVGRVLAGHSIGEDLEVTTLEAVTSCRSLASTTFVVTWEAFTLLLISIMILWALVLTSIPIPVASTLVTDMGVEAVARAPLAPRMALATQDLAV